MRNLECVGHYQKRVGNRLRRLKKADKVFDGRGCLADAVIDRIQNYFGVVIHQNKGNLAALKAGTLTSLFQVPSSEKNSHTYLGIKG